MRLKCVVLESTLPLATFGATSQEQWVQSVPTARFLSKDCELDYDASTQLVRIKKNIKAVHVHISRVLFMEMDAEAAVSEEVIDRAAAVIAKLPDSTKVDKRTRAYRASLPTKPEM